MGDIAAQKEQKELKARQVYKKAVRLMEHLEGVLIDKENVLNQETFFRLAFKELPTHEDLVNGTLNLHQLFKLKSSALSSKRQCVTPRGVSPPGISHGILALIIKQLFPPPLAAEPSSLRSLRPTPTMR